MLESAAADRAYLARHDTALKSLMSTQGCRGLVRFSTSVALVLGFARALLSNISGHLLRRFIRSMLNPLVGILHQQLRQKTCNERTMWLDDLFVICLTLRRNRNAPPKPEIEIEQNLL